MSQARQTEIAEFENEGLTKFKGVINSDHAYIHKGIAYAATLDIGALAAAASESYSFKTAAASYLHLKHIVLTAIGASVKLEIMRGTTASPLTVDSAGDAATELAGPNNANDNSTNTTSVVIKKTPTYTDNEEGEVWDFVKVLGTSTNQFESVADESFSENYELILKPDTYYVLKVTNLSAGGGDAATDVLVRMAWYEESKGVS